MKFLKNDNDNASQVSYRDNYPIAQQSEALLSQKN